MGEKITPFNFHEYLLTRSEDPGFPKDYDTKKKQLQLKELKNQIQDFIAKLAGKLDISSNKVSSKGMFQFVSDILQTDFSQ